MGDYYDRNGQPITFEQWSALRADLDAFGYRRVGLTEVSRNVEVSTVWLGINHNWSDDGPPLIFETMIFGGPLDQEQWRYATEADAERGHEDAVRLARAAVQVDEEVFASPPRE